MLARLIPDRFILLLTATIVLASLLPARGAVLAVVTLISNVAIFMLFFFHGLKLPRASVVAGARQWRLQATILIVSFIAFPLAGLALASAVPGLLSPPFWAGVLFLCALPSTVQSAISYSAIGGGNVAASVIAAALSNVLGVVITPLIIAFMMQSGGASVGGGAIGKIALLLLLPFAIGQFAQPRLATWADTNRGWIARMDKLTILLAVYAAFSAAAGDGLWSRLTFYDGAALLLIASLLLTVAMGGAWALGRTIGLPREDRITLMFSASHKTLATGAPMAQILFAGSAAGTIIIPLMIYHQLQLIVSAWLASRFSRAT